MGRRGMFAALLVGSCLAVGACKNNVESENAAALEGEGNTQVAQALFVAPANCDTPTTPFCNSKVAPPADPGHLFALAQNYPAAPGPATGPWTKIDAQKQPEKYLQAVLGYFYQGNIRPDVETSFDPALNKVRGWYNAPWQDFGPNGREPLHGLTRERVNAPGELAKTQVSYWNNYAVGFYNAPGGYTIARVWADHGKPNATLARFPEGTVAAKLLFTTADEHEVPYLAGAPTWTAYIYKDVHNQHPKAGDPRAKTPVRLLQIDIAVKDKRAPLGWYFGTFVYGGGPGGKPGKGWENVAPVGMMWGNDPGYSGSGPLTQTKLNQPAVQMPHYGYQNRLNGPVDNPASSCMSCHATAQLPSVSMFPPTAGDPAWFQNIKSGQPSTPCPPGKAPTRPGQCGTAVDYSLQLWSGLVNFGESHRLDKAPPAQKAALVKQLLENDTRTPRDGGTHH
jgi:hypothetical protein